MVIGVAFICLIIDFLVVHFHLGKKKLVTISLDLDNLPVLDNPPSLQLFSILVGIGEGCPVLASHLDLYILIFHLFLRLSDEWPNRNLTVLSLFCLIKCRLKLDPVCVFYIHVSI